MRRPAKRSKYRAVPTVVDGIRFASKKEARRWQVLRLLEKAGEIIGLERQKKYNLCVNGYLIAIYISDFRYVPCNHRQEGEGWIVEDVKGFKTPEYKLKKKLMKAIYGIEIRET